MIGNMPADSFLFYYGIFGLEFLFVIGYGIWWYLQGKQETGNGK